MFVIVAAAVLFFVFRSEPSKTTIAGNTTTASSNEAAAKGAPGQGGAGVQAGTDEDEETTEGEESAPEETKSATELYSSADQALEAVKKAAAEYDDLVLEQFTRPGPDCTWCDQFYAQVKDLMKSPDTSQETRGYYAELLAVSGRVDNISTLVDSIKNAKDATEADTYSEALELASGGDDVVRFLGSQMDSKNEAVQEASIAAVTNQGTRLAAELLYDQTAKAGDADGYYSRGIGLGEFIPDPEALPYLQELVKKQDQYSPLAVKALINSGMDGLRLVFDELNSVKDPEVIKKMLNGAEDHVNYEEGVEAYLAKIAETSQQPALVDFAKKVLEDFKNSADENTDTNTNMSVDPSLGGGEEDSPEEG